MDGRWVECKKCLSTFFYEYKSFKPKRGSYNGLYCPFCGGQIPPVDGTISRSTDKSLVIEDRLIKEIDKIGFIQFE